MKHTVIFGHKVRWADVNEAVDELPPAFSTVELRAALVDKLPELGHFAARDLANRVTQRRARAKTLKFDGAADLWRKQ